MKTLKNLAGVALVSCGIVLSSGAQSLSYYSDFLFQTNLIINASGGNGGTTTNLVSGNYSATLQDGWVSTKAINLANPGANSVTFSIATRQLPTGFTGILYTNAGFVYSNGVTIAAVVVPQFATNLTMTLALGLDDLSKSMGLPPSTNNVITATATTSASTNVVQNWIFAVPATNFLGAKWYKVLAVTYGGSNALAVVSARAGSWAGTW